MGHGLGGRWDLFPVGNGVCRHWVRVRAKVRVRVRAMVRVRFTENIKK